MADLIRVSIISIIRVSIITRPHLLSNYDNRVVVTVIKKKVHKQKIIKKISPKKIARRP